MRDTSMQRLLATLCTGAVILATAPLPAAAARSDPTGRQLTRSRSGSLARCTVSSSSASMAQSAAVANTLAVTVAAFLCDDDDEVAALTVQGSASAVAEAQASGFARAVADVSVDCFLTGQSSIRVRGMSVAMAEATLIAELFVEGVATAAVCDSCSSEARFHARRMADTLLQAVAVAEVNVLESSSGASSRDVVVGRFVEDVVEGSAVATGQVLATAVSSLDTVCSATLDFVGTFDGNTGDQSPPDAVFCRVNASTATATQVLSMSATASQSLAEFACEDPSESQAMQTATAISTAVALAVANAVAACDIGGSGVACATVGAAVNEAAEASALAFASGMATAGSSCEPPLCSVSVQDTADAFFPAIAEAAAAALQQGCTDGETGTLNLEQFESVMSVSSVESIAAVLVQARVDGPLCQAIVDVTAANNPVPPPPTPPLTAVIPAFPPSPVATPTFLSYRRFSFIRRGAEETSTVPQLPDPTSIQATVTTSAFSNATAFVTRG